MFRFSIREILLLTTVIGLAIACYRDHNRLCEVTSDAEFLASVTVYGVKCGYMAGQTERLQVKYGVKDKDSAFDENGIFGWPGKLIDIAELAPKLEEPEEVLGEK